MAILGEPLNSSKFFQGFHPSEWDLGWVAAIALGTVAPKTEYEPEAIEALIALLGSDDTWRRGVAGHSLMRMSAAARMAIPSIVAALERSLASTEIDP